MQAYNSDLPAYLQTSNGRGGYNPINPNRPFHTVVSATRELAAHNALARLDREGRLVQQNGDNLYYPVALPALT